jgi:hypothetical protein
VPAPLAELVTVILAFAGAIGIIAVGIALLVGLIAGWKLTLCLLALLIAWSFASENEQPWAEAVKEFALPAQIAILVLLVAQGAITMYDSSLPTEPLLVEVALLKAFFVVKKLTALWALASIVTLLGVLAVILKRPLIAPYLRLYKTLTGIKIGLTVVTAFSLFSWGPRGKLVNSVHDHFVMEHQFHHEEYPRELRAELNGLARAAAATSITQQLQHVTPSQREWFRHLPERKTELAPLIDQAEFGISGPDLTNEEAARVIYKSIGTEAARTTKTPQDGAVTTFIRQQIDHLDHLGDPFTLRPETSEQLHAAIRARDQQSNAVIQEMIARSNADRLAKERYDGMIEVFKAALGEILPEGYKDFWEGFVGAYGAAYLNMLAEERNTQPEKPERIITTITQTRSNGLVLPDMTTVTPERLAETAKPALVREARQVIDAKRRRRSAEEVRKMVERYKREVEHDRPHGK